MPTEEQFIQFRSQLAADVRAGLGSLAYEHVFYGEGTTGVFGDLTGATHMACRMVGTLGMGAENLDPELSRKAANIGAQLIYVVDIPTGQHPEGSWTAAVLHNV